MPPSSSVHYRQTERDRLTQAGAAVLALDLSATGLAETRSTASGTGTAEIETVVVDVADAAAVETALATESFDVVVNAAGIMAPESLFTTTRADSRMSRPGSVIQIASIQAHIGVAFPSHTAAKGAIVALSRQLGADLPLLGEVARSWCAGRRAGRRPWPQRAMRRRAA